MKINSISLCSGCSWLHVHENFVKFPSGSNRTVKNPPTIQESQVDPWVRRKWLPTPVFLPGESCGQKSLVGYSPRSFKESDTTERLTLSLSISVYAQGVHGYTFLKTLSSIHS